QVFEERPFRQVGERARVLRVQRSETQALDPARRIAERGERSVQRLRDVELAEARDVTASLELTDERRPVADAREEEPAKRVVLDPPRELRGRVAPRPEAFRIADAVEVVEPAPVRGRAGRRRI